MHGLIHSSQFIFCFQCWELGEACWYLSSWFWIWRNESAPFLAEPLFRNLRGLAELLVMLVKTGKVSRYDIVYKLLKLLLVLPIATAGVERIFSTVNYIKTMWRNKNGKNTWIAAWLNLLKWNSSCKQRMRTSSIIFKAWRIIRLYCNL